MAGPSTFREVAASKRESRAHRASVAGLLFALAGCAVELGDTVDDPLEPGDWTGILDAPDPVPVVEPPSPPVQELMYQSSNIGCFHQKESSDSVHLSETELADLRAVVLASRAEQSFDARSLGITQERLDAQAHLAINAVARVLTDRKGAPRPSASLIAATRDRVRPLLTLDYVTAAAQQQLKDADGSTTQAELRVKLMGEPPIALSSKHGSPWMLPWKVELGSESWETYSKELPLALSRHLPPSVTNYTLLDGRAYWQNDFWEESYGWLAPLAERLQREDSLRVAEGLPGYTESRSTFSIETADIGWINMQPLSLHLTLVATGPQPVDAVWWFNPMGAKGPRHGWSELLQQYSRVNRTAESIEWLKDWKSRPGPRSVESHIAGRRMYEERDVDTFVTPAWKHAGLPGAPTIELMLRRGTQAMATLFLSEATRGAVIISANNFRGRPAEAPASDHWLDVESVSFHPTAPTYLFVDAAGQFERKTIPEDFPPLQRVLRKLHARLRQ